jgi:hypothetical protein
MTMLTIHSLKQTIDAAHVHDVVFMPTPEELNKRKRPE